MRKCDRCGKENTEEFSEDVEEFSEGVESYHISIVRQPLYDQGSLLLKLSLNQYFDWCSECKRKVVSEISSILSKKEAHQT